MQNDGKTTFTSGNKTVFLWFLEIKVAFVESMYKLYVEITFNLTHLGTKFRDSVALQLTFIN